MPPIFLWVVISFRSLHLNHSCEFFSLPRPWLIQLLLPRRDQELKSRNGIWGLGFSPWGWKHGWPPCWRKSWIIISHVQWHLTYLMHPWWQQGIECSYMARLWVGKWLLPLGPVAIVTMTKIVGNCGVCWLLITSPEGLQEQVKIRVLHLREKPGWRTRRFLWQPWMNPLSCVAGVTEDQTHRRNGWFAGIQSWHSMLMHTFSWSPCWD